MMASSSHMRKCAARWSAFSAPDDCSLVARSCRRFRGYCWLHTQGKSLRIRTGCPHYLRQHKFVDLVPASWASGENQSTRELVLTPLPFIAVYRVKLEVVEIVRVLHGSQRWP